MLNRKRMAYATALRVVLSYQWLNLKSKFLGAAYKRREMPRTHARNAERVKNTVLQLKGLFIKFGQLVSILANVLPEAFREPLESLQDKIPPRPYAEVEATFLASLGKSPEDCFDSFEKTPIAAASIGQVHLGMKDGIKYAVKIQHADIEGIAKADLQILKRLVQIHSWFMDIKGSDYLYAQIAEMIRQELDYSQEKIAMQRIGKAIAELPELQVQTPEVLEEISTSKVLVSTFFEGKKIGNRSQIEAWNIDPKSVAERLILLYCHLILKDGYYHADPHPGNFLINEKGVIALLDFGAVATLNEALKTAIPELIEAILKNDTEATVAALKKMGFLTTGAESERIAERLVGIARNFLEEEVQLDGLDFSNIELKSGAGSILKLLQKVDLREVSSSIQIPKDYVLLYRTVMLLLGLSFQLAPEHNPIDTMRPFVKENLLANSGSLSQTILSALKRQLTTAVALPAALERFLKKANRDELKLNVKRLDYSVQKIYQLGQQFLFAALSGFSFIMADDGRGDWFYGLSTLSCFLFLRALWLGRR